MIGIFDVADMEEVLQTYLQEGSVGQVRREFDGEYEALVPRESLVDSYLFVESLEGMEYVAPGFVVSDVDL